MSTRRRRIRRPSFLFGISLLLVGLALATLLLWVFERSHQWANNWLPNFVAEWTGILIAVFFVDEWRRREREAQLRPLRSFCYGELMRLLENLGVNARWYLELFTPSSTGLEPTDDRPEAVRRMDVALPAGAVTDHNARENWLHLLRGRSDELYEISQRHLPFLPETVLVPVLELVNALRACATSASGETVWTTESYVPIGDAFARAFQAVTRARNEHS